MAATYINNGSKSELAHTLLTEGTHNKQGSNDALVGIIILLSVTLITPLMYAGSVLLTDLCVKCKNNYINFNPFT